MVLLREYRICMPLSVNEYKIWHLHMIGQHSLEQTESGEDVEIIENRECEDPVHGKGQYTEKRIHLSGWLPYWMQAILPKVFYVTEKAWNYYPYTVTEYTCSFLPKFNISIQTAFEDNNGSTENCLKLDDEVLRERIVDTIDIVYDDISPKYYKEEEDLRFFKSKKSGRGPLAENWQFTTSPVMCSYKVVRASFEVWGLQTMAEEVIQRSIREILLLGHRLAFAWIDELLGMILNEVREYKSRMHDQTNDKVNVGALQEEAGSPPKSSAPSSPTSPSALNISADKSWFGWS